MSTSSLFVYFVLYCICTYMVNKVDYRPNAARRAGLSATAELLAVSRDFEVGSK